MRIVIISDIHGNYDALQGLKEDYDELWVLGDLVNDDPLTPSCAGPVSRGSLASEIVH